MVPLLVMIHDMTYYSSSKATRTCPVSRLNPLIGYRRFDLYRFRQCGNR